MNASSFNDGRVIEKKRRGMKFSIQTTYTALDIERSRNDGIITLTLTVIKK